MSIIFLTIKKIQLCIDFFTKTPKITYVLWYVRYDRMLSHETLLYSLIPWISWQDIQDPKKSSQFTYDHDQYQKLRTWSETYHVQALIIAEDHNLKWSRIKPRPKVLYFVGNKDILYMPLLWIVGPRKMSGYAKEVLEHMYTTVPHYFLGTISGMAEGVDKYSHNLSIKHHIPTIAVIGGWLWWYFKRSERKYIQTIVENWWLVISEFRLGEAPSTYTFPQRNRIIAGLSDVLFLPEASKNSWSLITVEYAYNMHIPIYATPNSIFAPTSEWVLELMQKGQIHPVFHISSMLQQHFSSLQTRDSSICYQSLTSQEQDILHCFDTEAQISLTTLLTKLDLWLDSLIEHLTALEMKWYIKEIAPEIYTIFKP